MSSVKFISEVLKRTRHVEVNGEGFLVTETTKKSVNSFDRDRHDIKIYKDGNLGLHVAEDGDNLFFVLNLLKPTMTIFEKMIGRELWSSVKWRTLFTNRTDRASPRKRPLDLSGMEEILEDDTFEKGISIMLASPCEQKDEILLKMYKDLQHSLNEN